LVREVPRDVVILAFTVGESSSRDWRGTSFKGSTVQGSIRFDEGGRAVASALVLARRRGELARPRPGCDFRDGERLRVFLEDGAASWCLGSVAELSFDVAGSGSVLSWLEHNATLSVSVACFAAASTPRQPPNCGC
jgi:hypothetical protein